MPVHIGKLALVNAKNKVYAIGGYHWKSKEPTREVLRLDCKGTLDMCVWNRLNNTNLAIARASHSVIPMTSAQFFRNRDGNCEKCPFGFEGENCGKCSVGFDGENCCMEGFSSSKYSSSRCESNPSNYFLKIDFKMPVKNKICIFLGNYTSSTSGLTYNCVNATKDYINFYKICREELTSCPEVNAVLVNQGDQIYADVIMVAKKVQIRYNLISRGFSSLKGYLNYRVRCIFFCPSMPGTKVKKKLQAS